MPSGRETPNEFPSEQGIFCEIAGNPGPQAGRCGAREPEAVRCRPFHLIMQAKYRRAALGVAQQQKQREFATIGDKLAMVSKGLVELFEFVKVGSGIFIVNIDTEKS